MNIIEESLKLMSEGYICNNCLGRQFAQLLSNTDNKSRGNAIRSFIAMSIDSGQKFEFDIQNLSEFKFNNQDLDVKIKKHKKCYMCLGVFDKLNKLTNKIELKMAPFKFDTFLVGTKLTKELGDIEEKIWDMVGFDYCETMKAEVNREIGKKLSKKLNKNVDFLNQNLIVLIDFASNKIEVKSNPLFIFGKYKKFGKTSYSKNKGIIEKFVIDSILHESDCSKFCFHGMGYEDEKTRCLCWRPFILKIFEPKNMKINLSRLQKEINKNDMVKISSLRFSSKEELMDLKDRKFDKTYMICIKLKNPIDNTNLDKLYALKDVIQRSFRNKLKTKKIKIIEYQIINNKKIELKIKVESGFRIKNFVNGDSKPNIEVLLQNNASIDSIDVLKLSWCKNG